MRHSHAMFMAGAFALAGCGDDLDPPPVEDDHTIVLRMQATIPPGTEVEYCQFVPVPDAFVTRDRVEFTSGSHHVLLYQTPYTAIPTQKDTGEPVDTSKPFDCSDGPTNGWSVTKLIGGSQNREGESLLAFPEGVAIHVGGIALLNVHYINAFDAPIDTDVVVELDTLPAEDVVQEGDLLFLYNPFISVPAGQTATARWTCPVYSDITIANIQSHMHSRGIGYEARINTDAPFYKNDRWEGVPVQHYDNFTVRAGSTLDYQCNYRNTTGSSIYQGPRTTDEMCMLIGSYYPADPRTANCTDVTGQMFGGDVVGQGTATCQATMGCFQKAQGLPAVTDCVLAAKPEVSHEASEVLRCMSVATDPGAECGEQIATCSTL
jgi:Copper type II ascorbate-dependent monooxygenase, C-terminal domain